MIKVERRPRSGRKQLTNIIRIVRAEWLDWLRKGHRKAYAIAACARAKPDFHLATFRRKIGWRWLLDRIDWFAENCKIGRIWVDVGRDH